MMGYSEHVALFYAGLALSGLSSTFAAVYDFEADLVKLKPKLRGAQARYLTQ